MRSCRSQRGLAAAMIIIVIILAAVAVVLGRDYLDKSVDLNRRETTDANLRRIGDAVAAFAALNRRLPCPADGRLQTGHASAGLEERNGSQECNVGFILTAASNQNFQTNGVIPWRSLGLAETFSLDGWGNRLTYRVAPELVRDNAMNFTACDTAGTGATSGGQCNSGCSIAALTAGCTAPATVTSGKGLPVRKLDGTLVSNPAASPSTGAAYVVLSHGGNGQGAYSSQGALQAGTPSSGTLEEANNAASVTFVTSLSTTAPPIVDDAASYAEGTGHFDDMVLRPTILEVVEAAKMSARTRVSGAFSAQDLANILGYTPDPSTNASTERTFLDFGIFAVTAVGSSAREVSFGQGASGTGIGSIGAGLTDNTYATINSQSGEGLYFVFDAPGRYLGITLVDFGTQLGDPERVLFYFKVGGSWVQIPRTACRTGNVLANFNKLNPGGDFTEAYVESRDTATGVTSSQFLIGAIKSCPVGSADCVAPGAVPANNCP